MWGMTAGDTQRHKMQALLFRIDSLLRRHKIEKTEEKKKRRGPAEQKEKHRQFGLQDVKCQHRTHEISGRWGIENIDEKEEQGFRLKYRTDLTYKKMDLRQAGWSE